jgi:hypothetical protein
MSQLLLAVAGLFSIALGLVHVAIPRLFDLPAAIGEDGPTVQPLRRLRLAGRSYQVRRRDGVGLTWVMSNAASYVLITIGLVDLAWLAGWRGLPIAGAALWIAGWWGLRAAGQLGLGRRRLDLAFVAWFGLLATVHLGLCSGALAP